ncbi:MAG: 4Fe-4S dicluster domain-containing protein [candidate division Zixibacteria bacterium]|nr:4Fe-4S dicluster domain-containing protein [candidate division Zixibacteria bacterium]
MPLEIIKFSSDEKYKKKVMEISGQNFHKCYQCGTCSGSCPMAEHLTILPRRVMALLQLGVKEELDKSNTPWTCASCHTCMVRCPRGIDIAKVMEALRLIRLRQNINQIEPSNLTKKEIVGLPQIAMVSGFRKLTS